MSNRYVFTVLISVIYSMHFSLDASEMVSRIAIQDGYKLSINDGVTSPAPISFFLEDPTTKGEWEIEILNNKENFMKIDCLEAYPGYCIIEPKNFNWNEAFRDYDPESNRDFFIFRLSFNDKNGNLDEMYFKWGLLPSKPLLSDIVFTYEYNWEDDMIYPNGDFSFEVESKDADRYWLYFTYSFLFGPPYWFTAIREFEAEDNKKIGYDADWGEFVKVAAINNFGYVHSDTICTTDYITDTLILDRIQTLGNINNINTIQNKPSFKWDNEKISLNRQMDINVFDLAGNLIRKENDTNTLYLSDIAKGIYLVVCKDNKNTFTNKIIKK
ncbi:MAG: T9SS type A sorting domain-containing protein [Muribaculaceae bacterium]|nr:T9SS type A sorting domain-containing protein [Muribaculaceae bacterium]